MGTTFRRNSMMNKGGAQRELPPLQNVAVLITNYVLEDKRKSNPQKDIVEGLLLHDVPEWGLKAEFTAPASESEAPVPLTRVKVSMAMPIDRETKRPLDGGRRRDIFGLSRPKGAGAAMDEGAIVVFEKAYLNKAEGLIISRYAHGCASSQQLQQSHKNVFSDMHVCVRPEDVNLGGPKKGQPTGRVDVLIADTKGAFIIADKAELKSAVDSLTEVQGIGNPGFQLLARQLVPAGVDPVAFASNPETRFGAFSVSRRKALEVEGQEKQWIPETGDELLARFEKENEGFTDIVGADGWQVEFVPMMAVNQAKSLVPSLVEVGEKVKDNSKIYAIYGQVGDGDAHARNVVTNAAGTRYGQIDCGWIPSHVVCERKETERGDIWYSTFQNAMGKRMNPDSIHDVMTGHTPDYHVAAIKAEGARIAAVAKAYFDAAGPASEATEEQAPEGPAPGR